jgi:hypothetical protein
VNADLAVVLLLLAAAIAMFAMNRPRMDAVGLIMMTVLPFTGVITVNEAIAGFSDSSIVLLGALFVIGEGLVRTGVAQRLGDWLIATAGSSETRLLALLMSAVAVLGAFMSSTGVVAIFIPVALRIAQSTGAAPSRLNEAIGRQFDAAGLLQRDGEGQHADDQHDALPVDRAIRAVEVDAPEDAHHQARDQDGLDVRHDAADHQPYHQHQAEQRLKRLAGGGKDLGDLARQAEDEQIARVGAEPLDVLPGADHQQRVADPELLVEQRAGVRDAANAVAR